jgi:hypothetical protein
VSASLAKPGPPAARQSVRQESVKQESVRQESVRRSRSGSQEVERSGSQGVRE